MPGFLVHSGPAVTCVHAGPMVAVPSTPPRVTVGGFPVVPAADVMTVPECPAKVCKVIVWENFSTRVLVNGQPIALQLTPPPSNANGLCVPPAPPVKVPALTAALQIRVLAI
ncbi:hypothetical protein [Amycolatopsis suaedae]|uniref:DUF4280 domain-containing protein n=1 Tax=Amycolatopsis suaedae TaxID=2510978 RepID=A0A4Q7J0G2_9PSEU|nr:hypothetical protein [Amycolatopsis suaedae]RZQ60042.1 hypothetical protein EWH70_30500 [Amycolatopsis suaedae]